MLSTLFFGGINLLGIGIIGEYVARIYDQLKGRPEYVVDRASEPSDVPKPAADASLRPQTRTVLWRVSSSSSHP
jgi:hypothetical protein